MSYVEDGKNLFKEYGFVVVYYCLFVINFALQSCLMIFYFSVDARKFPTHFFETLSKLSIENFQTLFLEPFKKATLFYYFESFFCAILLLGFTFIIHKVFIKLFFAKAWREKLHMDSTRKKFSPPENAQQISLGYKIIKNQLMKVRSISLFCNLAFSNVLLIAIINTQEANPIGSSSIFILTLFLLELFSFLVFVNYEYIPTLIYKEYMDRFVK